MFASSEAQLNSAEFLSNLPPVYIDAKIAYLIVRSFIRIDERFLMSSDSDTR